MSESRIDSLEIALAHQDHQIQELGEIVTRQWDDIRQLRAALDRALAKLAILDAGAPSQDGTEGLSVSELAALEKPPHY